LVGEQVTKSRNEINRLKSSIERLRRRRALDEISSSRDEKFDDGDAGSRVEEEMYCENIEAEKVVYKSNFSALRGLKSDIENVQKLIEKGRRRVQQDFDVWYGAMTSSDASKVGEAAPADGYEGGRQMSADVPGEKVTERSERLSSVPLRMPSGTKLTGNTETDNDIIAFYRAKELLLARTGGRVGM